MADLIEVKSGYALPEFVPPAKNGKKIRIFAKEGEVLRVDIPEWVTGIVVYEEGSLTSSVPVGMGSIVMKQGASRPKVFYG